MRGISHLIIPQSVTSIGSSAFNGCSGLTNVIIPAGTAVARGAFDGCSGLPANVLAALEGRYPEESDESDDEYSQNGYSTGPGTMPQAASPADTQVPVL